MSKYYVLSVVLLGILAASATAAPVIAVDEWGNGIGTVGPGVVMPDPISGLPALTYTLPFLVLPGDVVILEPAQPNQEASDLIRFLPGPNGGPGNLMLFFSDRSETAEAPVPPADTGIPPASTAFPVAVLVETGPEDANFADYMPDPAGGPGGIPGAAISYHFVSDGVVPLPTSVALGAAGFGLMGIFRIIRRRRAA